MRVRHALRRATGVCVLAVLALPTAAQVAGAAPGPAAVTPATAGVPAPPAADEPRSGRRVAEPNVQRIVSEDDNVRIDELRVRGQTRELVVRHKAVAGSRYEILPGEGGRDPSTQDKRSGGQSVWRLFSF